VRRSSSRTWKSWLCRCINIRLKILFLSIDCCGLIESGTICYLNKKAFTWSRFEASHKFRKYVERIEEDKRWSDYRVSDGHHKDVIDQPWTVIDLISNVLCYNHGDQDWINHLSNDRFDGQTSLLVCHCIVSLKVC